MTIKELEDRLDMTRANIRFYEQEGLLTPARTPNGYRDYSEEDIRTLEKIKLLRQLQFDLDTIRALQSGERSLTDALSDQLGQLDADQTALEGSRSVCARLWDTAVSFEALDAAPWLRELGQLPDSQHFAAPRDELPPPPGHPWRRRFARGFDLTLCVTLYQAFRQFVLHLPVPVEETTVVQYASYEEELAADFAELAQLLPWNMAREFFTPEDLLSVFIPFLLMLLLEPLLLHLWGTTPGKFLFGMKLRDSEGEKLSLSDAFFRTWGALFWGLGLNIPYFGFWRLWHSYSTVEDRKERNRWEYVHSTGQPEQYLIPEGKRYCIPFVLLCLLSVLINLLRGGLFSYMPPHNYYGTFSNDLTEAEFEENYQFYLNRYYSDRLAELAAEPYPGQWTAILSEGYTTWTDHGREDENGEMVFEREYEYVPPKPIAFRYTLRAPASQFEYPSTYEMVTTAGMLAYAGAMPGETIITFHPHKMMRTLGQQELNYDFAFQMSAEGTLGKWYKIDGMSIPILDSRVYVSQTVIREATGEPIYSVYDDVDSPDEWLTLTFTVGISRRIRS